MKKVLIIGNGIAGLSSAISLAEKGVHATLVSPFPSERAQSVMAAGGINAVEINGPEASGDSIESHIADTLRGGHDIAGEQAVRGLCEAAPKIVAQLEKRGTIFTRRPDGQIDRRAFGGQSYDRTCYCGTSTGKQIVSTLVREARRYEAKGLIKRWHWIDFHSALIRDGQCYGVVIFNEITNDLETIPADAVIMATGGQNALFGKTTGSTTCDGYAAGRLLMQGVELKNLEFVQYHPTTIETAQKRMLISEAARGEGGRLFYEENGERVYFMEDKFGEKGNLMPRDVVSRCMYETGRQCYLDLTHLGADKIDARIPEVRDLCAKFIGLDVTKEPIPVAPSVHFFMGGIAVNNQHETNIKGLFAVGECASIYHGANRLGGNSMLAAIYGGQQAAAAIAARFNPADLTGPADPGDYIRKEFAAFEHRQREDLRRLKRGDSQFPVNYVREMLTKNLTEELGIVRDEATLLKGIRDIDYFLRIRDKIHYDQTALPYYNYSLAGIMTLAKAVMVSAYERKESRGAHYRSDYPNEDDAYKAASIIRMVDGEMEVRYDTEGQYES